MPGFHSWFLRKRLELLKAQAVQESLDRLHLNKQFTTDRLDVMHKIQKKNASEEDLNGEVTNVLNSIQFWIISYYKEIERAFYGQGKYRLASGYEEFYRDPNIFLSWSQERKQEHMKQFLH